MCPNMNSKEVHTCTNYMESCEVMTSVILIQRAPHTLHDSQSHNSVTGIVMSPCTQVLQSRDWLVGPLVRIWHVKSSRLIVDLGRAFAMAKCKVRMHQSQGSAICSCSVRCLLARLLVRGRVVWPLRSIVCRGLNLHGCFKKELPTFCLILRIFSLL